MSYPANAFAPVDLRASAPGTLAYSNGMWILRTDADANGGPRMLILEGPGSGTVARAEGIGICVADNAAWAVFLNEIKVSWATERHPAVSVGPQGVIIHGRLWQSQHELVFTKEGVQLEVKGGYQYAQSFSIWLVDEIGKKVGDAPLLTV